MGVRVSLIIACLSLGVAAAAVPAAEPKVVTLSCDGTLTRRMWSNGQPAQWMKPERVKKVGAVVNLDERTVSFLGYVASIGDVDAANLNFGGKQIGESPAKGSDTHIGGEIDRVTGYMDVTTTNSIHDKTGDHAVESHYEMVCKATDRVF
jgi:hypothetical protein